MRRQPTLREPRKIDNYCLRVQPDGQEVRFAGPPNESYGINHLRTDGCRLHVHHVFLFEAQDGSLFEEMETGSIKLDGGERFICPRPHGRGWTIHNEESDNYTIYRWAFPSGDYPMFPSIRAWGAATKGGAPWAR
jgi:hypothetical protein